MGAKHRPFYRVVVSESSRVPKAAFVENVGHYDPLREPPTIELHMDRIDHWVGMGAKPSTWVKKLMNAFALRQERGIPEAKPEAAPAPKAEEKPAEAKAEEAAPAAEEAAPEASAQEDAAASTEEE